MNPSRTMIEAALAGMTHVLDLVPEDRVLVVTDEMTGECGKAFALAAEQHGCDCLVYHLPETCRPLQKMPDDMHGLLEGVTVVINAIVGDEREIPFRLEWLFLVESSPVIRMGHSPGITTDMMASGPLNVDYERMQSLANTLIHHFQDAASVHITTPTGTDLKLELTGREVVSDLKAIAGTGANLPCGEVYCCPVENGADGTLVIDGCFGSHGIVETPLIMTLKKGQVVDVRCDTPDTQQLVQDLMSTDAGAATIAELGIGLNPGARLGHNMLESEKALRTAHIAFGSNQGMPGGKSTSDTHIDYLFYHPSMTITDQTGAIREVMVDGEVI